MRSILFFLILLVLCWQLPELRAQESKFRRATLLYERGDYGEAEREFLRLWEEGSEKSDPKVLVNLAHSYYQLGRYAEALLFYERALNLVPANPEIEAAITLTESRLGFEDMRDDSLGGIPELIRIHFSASTIVVWSVLLQGFFLALAYLLGNRRLKISALIAALGILILSMVVLQEEFSPPGRAGLIMRSDSNLRDEPRTEDSPRMELRAGQKVEILESSDRWMRVRLRRNGDIGAGGWVKSDRVSEVLRLGRSQSIIDAN